MKRLIAIAALSMSLAAQAENRIAVSAGESLHRDASNFYRAAFQYKMSDNVFNTDYTLVEAYLDLAASVWNHSDDVLVVSVSPVLRIKPQHIGSDFKPFIDVGVGPAYVSETTYGNRDLGQHLQFENRIGLGVEHGNKALSVNAFHYSNAGLADENAGTDWIVGTFSVEF